jgi:D-alanyl-D-alanine carboxypeptidase
VSSHDEDLCRYAAAHFLGIEKLLSDASKREMQQPYWHVAQTDLHFGLGFDISDTSDRLLGHNGGILAVKARTLFDPRDGLVVVVLINEIGDVATPLTRVVVRILGHALGQPPAAQNVQLNLNDYFAVRFASILSVTDVATFGETLVALSTDADDPLQSVTKLSIEDPDMLRSIADTGFGSPGETVRCTRDDTGRVVRVVVGGVHAYPLDIYCAKLGAVAITYPALAL